MLSPGSSTSHFTLISLAKASHVARQGREIQLYHMSRKRPRDMCTQQPSWGNYSTTSYKGLLSLRRDFCLAGFKMEHTMVLVKCISTAHALCSSCATHPVNTIHVLPLFRNILPTILHWVQLASTSKLCSRITSCMKLPFDEATCVWFYLGKYFFYISIDDLFVSFSWVLKFFPLSL